MVRWDQKRDLMLLLLVLREAAPTIRDTHIRAVIANWPKSAGDPPSSTAVTGRISRLRHSAFPNSPRSIPSTTPKSSPAKKLAEMRRWDDAEDDEESPRLWPPREADDPFTDGDIRVKSEVKAEPTDDDDTPTVNEYSEDIDDLDGTRSISFTPINISSARSGFGSGRKSVSGGQPESSKTSPFRQRLTQDP